VAQDGRAKRASLPAIAQTGDERDVASGVGYGWAMLVGRDRECARIDGLLARARAGTAGVLLLLGEPGIGKTALLDYAAARADDMTVVRAVGLESEAQLEFSALFDVCRPLLDRLDELAVRQREALTGALGIGPGASADRLLVGAATLSLLAAAAEDTPVLVLLDDVQWLDAASADGLLFAARRLAAERVAVLGAGRQDGGGAFDPRTFASEVLAGIERDAAAALVASRAGSQVALEVAGRIRGATGGNPLALMEVAGLLNPSQLLGIEPLVDPLPVGSALERVFAERVLRLPEPARQALLIAAVSSTDCVEPMIEALGRFDLDERALELAEDAGLIAIGGGSVAFRHPLVRSAVVHRAAASERRRAHRALADALAGSQEERAWHLAAAALGADEQAAAALAEAGRRTRARSGWASAALALERAARLTPDPETRQRRMTEAAEASLVAGRIELTLALTDELLSNATADGARARAIRLRSRIELHFGDVAQAFDHLLEAAALLAGDDRSAAVALLTDAVQAAELLGEPGRAVAAVTRAAALAPDDGQARFATAFACGQACRLDGRPADARAHLQRALELLTESDELQASVRGLWQGATAAGRLGRLPEGLALARRSIELAREQGAFGPLGHALAASSELAVRAARWPEARAQASEGLELARESRCAWAATQCLEQLAWLDAAEGSEEPCRARAAEAVDVATRAGFASPPAQLAVGLLELGLGRAQEAAHTYDAVGSEAPWRAHPGFAADLVEAWVRSGRIDEATAAYERVLATEPDAVAARCRGLLAADAFDAPFQEALASHAEHDAFGLARTQVCYGERLRRAGRRIDARDHLRAAHSGFDRLGARPWTERAAAELKATGERLGRRDAQRGEDLTAQELQVALQVAEGKTNKEAGAALFLSPKTVDFHLRRVYRKLDIRSRGELIKRFAASPR
jgi:DNA-binding CsgD family transcriptional regulator